MTSFGLYPYRLIDDRPVYSQEQLTALGKKILGMTTIKTLRVRLEHRRQVIIRMSNGEVMSSDDGDILEIRMGAKDGGIGINVATNQISDEVLRAIVERCELLGQSWNASERLLPEEHDAVDEFVPVQLWHDSTVRAMRESRSTLLPEVLGAVAKAGLQAAGSVGFIAKSQAVFYRDKPPAFSEETDSELTVTARTRDGKSSGWGGQAARDWSQVDHEAVVARAVDMCQRSIGAQAIEPGRRTVILTPDAIAHLFRYFGEEFNAGNTISGKNTPFYTPHRPSNVRYGERMFDPRITMNSDPADPEGGYAPFFGRAWRNSPTTWVENGVLKELAYDAHMAAAHGRTRYAENPYSMRVSGGATTIDEMIAQCKEGIFVNRFSGVDLLSLKTGMMTGVTRDGCFLVKNGKIDRPVKNLRFLDSPFFMLNNVIALGKPKRAAYGYAPVSQGESHADWPRSPIILPPMMLKDFNFNALCDAI